MLRLVLRTIGINMLSIYLVAQILSGIVTYIGGYQTLLMAAVAISVVNLFVRPIINLLLLPLHLVTLGVFRWLANVVTLYLVTWMVPNLQIHAFVFPGVDLRYLIIPEMHFSAFGSFVVATIVLTITFHLIYWLLQD